MYFDGAVNKSGAGVGVIFFSPEGEWMLMSKKKDFKATNNMSEYEACIFGLEALIAMGVQQVEVMGDSMLVIYQVRNEWEVKEEKFKPYWQYIDVIKKRHFEDIKFRHLSREENQLADALAGLASVWEDPGKVFVRPLILVRSRVPCYEGERIGKKDPKTRVLHGT